jgi:hypothetical protein
MMRISSLIVIVLFLAAPPLLAQEQRGSIEGIVKDASGGVLPGATVETSSPALAGAGTTVTDAQGGYRFPSLPPGRYQVSATLQGFAPAKIDAGACSTTSSSSP